MAAVKALLRWFSLLFHLLLALFLMAISGLAMASSVPSLKLGMLPWTGSMLIRIVFFGALIGVMSVVLAALRKLRFLFFLWSLAVLYFMVKGYFLGGYRFSRGEATTALYLTIASLFAVLGAWFQMRVARTKSRY